MEDLQLKTVHQNHREKTDDHNINNVSSSKSFIEANTIDTSLEEIKEKHIIPVFIKDNETVISHADFIESTMNIVNDIFNGETILKPSIKLSHPIKAEYQKQRTKQLMSFWSMRKHFIMNVWLL
jgi:hypothetical protein